MGASLRFRQQKLLLISRRILRPCKRPFFDTRSTLLSTGREEEEERLIEEEDRHRGGSSEEQNGLVETFCNRLKRQYFMIHYTFESQFI